MGATEGAIFIRNHIINVTDRAFDDFAGSGADQDKNRKVLGLDPLPEPEVQWPQSNENH